MKHSKKEHYFFSIIITLLILVGQQPFPVQAASNISIADENVEAASNVGITISFGDNAYGTVDANGILTIKGSGPLKSVDDPDIAASTRRSTAIPIRKIIISDGITSLDDDQFSNYSNAPFHYENVVEIVIPESVSKIGNSAFRNCKSLEDIIIPDSVVELGNSAFFGCSSLKRVTLSDNIETLPSHTFEDCDSLRNVTLPAHLKKIEDNAFWACSQLSYIVIPAEVDTIEEFAFCYCDKLKGVFFLGKAPSFNSGSFFRGIQIGVQYDDIDLYYPENEISWSGRFWELNDFYQDLQYGPFKVHPYSIPFADVDSGSYYYVPLIWATANNITSGTTAATFSPRQQCTRGQMTMFLYKLENSPDVEGELPFSDVSKTSPYYKSVLWALQNGITSGTTVNTFDPSKSCTRGQMAMFLYKLKGQPEASGELPFTDVSESAYYRDAVLWATQNGITSGTTATTFSPSSTCIRAQMVVFLFNMYFNT